jgi:hypothetical protein
VDAEKNPGREPLPALLQADGVVGVSRLGTYPAFTGPVICTLAYFADAVRVEVVDARARGRPAYHGALTKPLRFMRHFGPLASWDRLRAAAFAAPSCHTLTEDGVSHHHALLDAAAGVEARWRNPSGVEHRQQWELASAYRCLVDSVSVLLEQGSRVRIRAGLLAGFVGTVERLDRYEDRVRVVAELGGKDVSVDLSVGEIEFPAEAEPAAAPDPARG